LNGLASLKFSIKEILDLINHLMQILKLINFIRLPVFLCRFLRDIFQYVARTIQTWFI